MYINIYKHDIFDTFSGSPQHHPRISPMDVSPPWMVPKGRRLALTSMMRNSELMGSTAYWMLHLDKRRQPRYDFNGSSTDFWDMSDISWL